MDEFVPGEIVLYDPPAGWFVVPGATKKAYVRYLGLFDGSAVIEDADGNRGLTEPHRLTRTDWFLTEPEVPTPPQYSESELWKWMDSLRKKPE